MYTKTQLNLIGSILDEVKKHAVAYTEITKRPLGVTSEIGEYEAAIRLDCQICPPRTRVMI